MSREDQHFRLRLPAELRALIEGAALQNKRSMTAEMIARLEGSFVTENSANIDKAAALLEKTEQERLALVEMQRQTIENVILLKENQQKLEFIMTNVYEAIIRAIPGNHDTKTFERKAEELIGKAVREAAENYEGKRGRRKIDLDDREPSKEP